MLISNGGKLVNRILIILSIILLINIGCKKNNMNKKTLKINYNVTPVSFHPHHMSDVRTETVCKALYENLTRMNPQGEVELALAQNMEISSCKTKYTFTLRDSVWSNGQKLSSQHLAKAWQRALDPKHSKCTHPERFFIIQNAKKVYKGELAIEELGIYTPDDQTIVIYLEHPAPYFIQQLADPVYSPIFSSNSNQEPTVFNGPFVLGRYDFDEKVVLDINPLYWDAKNVKLEGVEISVIKDAPAYLELYEKKELDYVGAPFVSIPDELIPKGALFKFKQASAPFWVYCNTKNAKLSSFKIRKALSLAIDRNEIIKHVISRQNEPLLSILPNKISCCDLPSDNLDKRQIIKLFEEGLEDVQIAKEDFRLTVNHCYSSEQRKIAEYLKYRWETVFGIRIHLQTKDWNSFYANLVSGDYEIGGCFVNNIYNDPSYLLGLFESHQTNFSRWEDPKYKKLLDLANQTIDEKQRKKYLQELEQILINEVPVLSIYNHGYVYFASDSLKEFITPEFNYADFKWAYFD